MSAFVLDASVTLRWLLETDHAKDQNYAWRVLDCLADGEAVVPELWYLEITNVLLNAEKEKLTTLLASERFIEQLTALPIRTDALTPGQAFTRTMAIARAARLSSYDAAYLELSVRLGLPIATLDRDLRKAAGRFDVSILDP
ncbi:MAG: type II toxin-antitoxin system VapC family toxin [Pseudomonadales bacterium]